MRLSRRRVESWGVASSVAVALFITACGGDDTEVVPLADSGQDRSAGGAPGADSGTDRGGSGGTAGAGGNGGAAGRGGSSGAAGGGGNSGAAGRGGSAGVAGSSVDGGGTGGGGTAGAGANDAGADSSIDAGGSGGSGQIDSGSDAPPDADAAQPLTIDQYQYAVAIAYCDRLIECCQVTPDRFDRDKCIRNNSTGFGPDRVFAYLKTYVGAGDAGRLPPTLFFEPSQAMQCVSLQRNRGCASEDGAEKRNLYETCINAVQGTLLPNAPCTTSQECRSDLYCQPGDAGSATCTSLVTLGQSCADPNLNSDRCVYLGVHSAASLHCSTFGGSGGTCVVGLDNGTACTVDQECASGVCSLLNSRCVLSQPNYPGPITCNNLIKPDAGADGGDGG
jgi:hypothetical protein